MQVNEDSQRSRDKTCVALNYSELKYVFVNISSKLWTQGLASSADVSAFCKALDVYAKDDLKW